MLTAEAPRVFAVADVRRFPRSRKYPHFNDDALTLPPQAGIQYVPFPALGGRRQTTAASVNTGWRNEGFRGYADYMQTPAFEHGSGRPVTVAARGPTAMMCAESVPWRCHRSLIADAMLVRGWDVLDIVSEAAPKPHSADAVRPRGRDTHHLSPPARNRQMVLPGCSIRYNDRRSRTLYPRNPWRNT